MCEARKMPTCKDLLLVEVRENGEKMADVRDFDSSIVSQYAKFDMTPITGFRIFVRNLVAMKLAKINLVLAEMGLRLKVVYGYRDISVQRKYFVDIRAVIAGENPGLPDADVDEATHLFVAVPEVAGHPTGGAVDVTIVKNDRTELDMGTKIADYRDKEKIRTFAKGLSALEMENRKLLREVMMAQHFAPFDGEWWHFSYGDREWAYYYGKPYAIYAQMHFSPVQDSLYPEKAEKEKCPSCGSGTLIEVNRRIARPREMNGSDDDLFDYCFECYYSRYSFE